MLKAILFDLDNTLINFWKMKKACCEAAIDAMLDSGLKMSRSKALQKLHKFYDKYGIEESKIFQIFLEEVNKKVDYKILSNAIVAYRKVRFGILEPYPFVESTLLKLREKGLKLAVVSDAPRLKCWIRLAYMRLDDFFDVVVAFEDTGQTKPGKLPFEKALKKLKCKPEEVLMVGDNVRRDIVGAKKLGIKTVFAKYGYDAKVFGKIKKSGADYEINDVKDVLGIVEKIQKKEKG